MTYAVAFTFMLMYIAGLVFVFQIKKWNAWPLICLYWFILAVKLGYELWLR